MSRGQILRLAGYLHREMERIAGLQNRDQQYAEGMSFVLQAIKRIEALAPGDRHALRAELAKRRQLHTHVYRGDAFEDCYEELEGTIIGGLDE